MKLSHFPGTVGTLCTLALILGPLASASQACWLFPWGGYSTYYGPTGGYTYTAGFGLGGLFGYSSYYGGYAPNYYAPSYAASGYATPGSASTYGGLAYAPSGGCCDNACPSGDCGIVTNPGQSNSPTPYIGEPVGESSPTPAEPSPTESTPGESSPSTYDRAPQTHPEEPFVQPRPIPGTGEQGEPGGGGILPPEDDSTTGDWSDVPSSVTPAGGTEPEIERDGGFDFDTYRRPLPDEQSPDDGEERDVDPEDDSHVIEPLNVETQVAFRPLPQRRRAQYRAIFRTPRVARAHVPDQSGWEGLPPAALAHTSD